MKKEKNVLKVLKKDGMLPQKCMGKKIIPIINKDGCYIDEEWQLDISIRLLKKIDKFSRVINFR